MEWHESLKLLLQQGNEEEEEDKKLPAQPQHRLQDLLVVVDNAKAHRRSLHESQNSTVAETQGSASSINLFDEDLAILFEEVDLYSGDDEDEFVADMHHSFPVTRRPRRRRRQRRQAQPQQQSRLDKNEQSFASMGEDESSPDRMQQVMRGWKSNSDSLIDYDSIDYNSLDDMLREENSQTASAMINVFQPERRRSFEVSALPDEMAAMMLAMDDDDDEEEVGEMDCKPPATISS